jgi:hypothetical protein
MNPSNAKNTSHRIEPTLSILGTLVTLVITVVIWKELASTQGIWPLPALYFVEMISGAGLCSLTFLMGSYHATRIAWIYTGIVTGFMLLGAFSIGFFYFPVFLLYGGLAIYSGLKHKKNIFLHLGLWLGTGILQAGLMGGPAPTPKHPAFSLYGVVTYISSNLFLRKFPKTWSAMPWAGRTSPSGSTYSQTLPAPLGEASWLVS